MMKIIGGKTYNTETAFRLATWTNNSAEFTDNTHIEESLYETLKGCFFLFCQGGFLSRYSRYKPTNRSRGGQMIIPITLEQAVEWTAKHVPDVQFWSIWIPDGQLEGRGIDYGYLEEAPGVGCDPQEAASRNAST